MSVVAISDELFNFIYSNKNCFGRVIVDNESKFLVDNLPKLKQGFTTKSILQSLFTSYNLKMWLNKQSYNDDPNIINHFDTTNNCAQITRVLTESSSGREYKKLSKTHSSNSKTTLQNVNEYLRDKNNSRDYNNSVASRIIIELNTEPYHSDIILEQLRDEYDEFKKFRFAKNPNGKIFKSFITSNPINNKIF